MPAGGLTENLPLPASRSNLRVPFSAAGSLPRAGEIRGSYSPRAMSRPGNGRPHAAVQPVPRDATPPARAASPAAGHAPRGMPSATRGTASSLARSGRCLIAGNPVPGLHPQPPDAVLAARLGRQVLAIGKLIKMTKHPTRRVAVIHREGRFLTNDATLTESGVDYGLVGAGYGKWGLRAWLRSVRDMFSCR